MNSITISKQKVTTLNNVKYKIYSAFFVDYIVPYVTFHSFDVFSTACVCVFCLSSALQYV